MSPVLDTVDPFHVTPHSRFGSKAVAINAKDSRQFVVLTVAGGHVTPVLPFAALVAEGALMTVSSAKSIYLSILPLSVFIICSIIP